MQSARLRSCTKSKLESRTQGKRSISMKIRKYAKAVGFEVVGKLRLVGKWNICTRWYADDEGNAYLIDSVLGTIRIIPNKRSRTQ